MPMRAQRDIVMENPSVRLSVRYILVLYRNECVYIVKLFPTSGRRTPSAGD